MRMRHYADLKVWQQSMNLAVVAYQCTASYPDAERYGLIAQTRRAAVSVSCNIAEGQGRSQPGEFLNQLSIARGSLQELETLCLLANRLGLLADDQLGALLELSGSISRMLTGLKKAVQRVKRVSEPHPPKAAKRNAGSS